jgi:hypothetical protein
MEVKWLMIGMAIILTGLAVDSSVRDYNNTQCKIAAITKGVASDDIVKLCK